MPSYYWKNKEKVLEYQKKYNQENKEKIKLYNLNYYANNRDKIREQQTLYNQLNPHARIERNAKINARYKIRRELMIRDIPKWLEQKRRENVDKDLSIDYD